MNAAINLVIGSAIAFSLISCAASGPRAEIERNYAKWDEAYRAADAETLISFLHFEFQVVTGTGRVIPRYEYMLGLGGEPKPEEYRTTVLRFESEDNRALAWTREVSRMPGESEHVHMYEDTWLRVDGEWLLYESKTLDEHEAE